ncbi:MAG: hypothetical protein V3W37_03160 [Candidatus Binatia bacterium]
MGEFADHDRPIDNRELIERGLKAGCTVWNGCTVKHRGIEIGRSLRDAERFLDRQENRKFKESMNIELGDMPEECGG